MDDENIPAAPTTAVPCGCGGAPLYDPEYQPASPEDHPLVWRVFNDKGEFVLDEMVAGLARQFADNHGYPAPVPVQF